MYKGLSLSTWVTLQGIEVKGERIESPSYTRDDLEEWRGKVKVQDVWIENQVKLRA
jgi:hypothetical protein